jgi:5-methylcytosine-specific restriction endonuclease McrA
MEPKTKPNSFKTFFRSLNKEQQEAFAEEAKTTTGNIRAHLIYARRLPRRESIENLWAACRKFGATFEKHELLAFFFEPQNDLLPGRGRPRKKKVSHG